MGSNNNVESSDPDPGPPLAGPPDVVVVVGGCDRLRDSVGKITDDEDTEVEVDDDNARLDGDGGGI